MGQVQITLITSELFIQKYLLNVYSLMGSLLGARDTESNNMAMAFKELVVHGAKGGDGRQEPNDCPPGVVT